MSESNLDYREEARKLIEFAKRICEAADVNSEEDEDASDGCKASKAEHDVNNLTYDFLKSKLPLDKMIEYPVAQLCNRVAVDKDLNVTGYHDLDTTGFKTAGALHREHINLSNPELSSSVSRSMSIKRSRSSHGVESTETIHGSKSDYFGRGVNDKHTAFPTNSPLQRLVTKSSESKLLKGAQNDASNIVDQVEGKCTTNQRRDHSGNSVLKEARPSIYRGQKSQACDQPSHNSAANRKKIDLQDMKRRKLVESAKNSTKLIKALLGKTSEVQTPVVPSSMRAPPSLSSPQGDSIAINGSYPDFSESQQFSSMPQSRYQSPANCPAAFQFDVGSFVNTKGAPRYTDNFGIAYTPGDPNHVTDASHLQQAQVTFFSGITRQNTAHYAQSQFPQLQNPYTPYILAPTTCNNDLFLPNHSKKRGGSPVPSRYRSHQVTQAYQQTQTTPSIPKGSSQLIPEPGSTRAHAKKVPKSLRRMGGIAKKYNLQEYDD